MYNEKSALIITYYRSKNYGAFLQAFAMQEFLKSNHIDVRIFMYADSVKTVALRRAYKLLKRQKPVPIEQQRYRKQLSNKILEQQDKLQMSKEKSFYDCTILGSDEIWNVKNVSSSHDSFMFCRNKESKRTISYAACSGNAKLKHLKLFPYAISGIKNLDAVGVRDDATYELVQEMGRRDVVRTLDPSFLIDFAPYLPDIKVDKPYLFVYTYGLTVEQIGEIKQLALKRNLAIIATGTYCDWADFNPVPNPFEWVSYIRGAEFVVTSTFHGTVFAIQQNRKFAVYNFKAPKIFSVLKDLKLVDRCVTMWRTLERLLDEPINYEMINCLVNEKRNFSCSYLLNQIRGDREMLPIKSSENLKKICYAARHKSSDVRWNSRSGGAFTALSDIILERRGIVYGVMLNEKFEAVHKRADSKIERDKMRGSKYVQSNLSVILPDILADLKSGNEVMFTGTPCQVDAVHKMAQVEQVEKKLVTVDFACHGVPSPLIWKEYLSLYRDIEKVDFRDKKTYGWEDHQETIVCLGKAKHADIYTNLYYSNMILRPCCHECPYAQYERFSDITIGDCWGVRKIVPKFDLDDSGVSMIMGNTIAGITLVEQALKTMETVELTLGQMKQSTFKKDGVGTCFPSEERQQFWNDFYEKGIKYICRYYSTDNTKARLRRRVRPPHTVRFAVKKMLGKV